MKWGDGDSAIGELGALVGIKVYHYCNWKVRWSATIAIANGCDSSHGTIHKAHVDPQVGCEHYTGSTCYVLHLSWRLFHELLPVTFSQLSIPETEKNMAEQYL